MKIYIIQVYGLKKKNQKLRILCLSSLSRLAVNQLNHFHFPVIALLQKFLENRIL